MLKIKTEDRETVAEPQLYVPPPMSNRWWLFLACLWTVILILAAPLFLIPTTERRSTIGVNVPVYGVISMTVIEIKPLLDWTGRHSKYELETEINGKVQRFSPSRLNWQIETTSDGKTQILSDDGRIVIPLVDSKEVKSPPIH